MSCGAAAASNWDVGVDRLVRRVGTLGATIGPPLDFYRFAVNPLLAMGALTTECRNRAINSVKVKMFTPAYDFKTLTFGAAD